MAIFAVSDADLDIGIDYAYKRFGCTIMRRNLLKVSDRFILYRQTQGLSFGKALRETLNFFKLNGDRREWYKAALGKMFSLRAHPMHKGRARKKPIKSVPVPGAIPTVLEGSQFAFGIARENPKYSRERINEIEPQA